MTGKVTSKGRTYNFYGNGTAIRINDNAGPYLRHLANTLPNEFNRALRHVGWWSREELQQAVYQGGPRGHRWPPLSGVHQQRQLQDLKSKRYREPATHPFGRLVRAIGYKHEKNLMKVRVGWLSRSAAEAASKVQSGQTIRVTPKMRRFFWAAGVPLTSDYINIPARELMEPFFRNRRGDIHERIERRVGYYLRKQEKKFSAGSALKRFSWAM